MNPRTVGLTLVLTAFFCFPLYLLSQIQGAPPRRTGGAFPGESSCATSDCHGGTPNSGPGSVAIAVNGQPIDQYRYQPGETVPVVMTVSDPNQMRWGFEITARTSDGCFQAGTFSPSPNDMVRFDEDTATAAPCPESTIQFPTHFFPKAGPGGASFEVNWTAPASDIGPIVFAAAGNAANGNSLRTGDNIYTTQQTVESTGGGAEKPTVFENGVQNGASNVVFGNPGHATAPGSIVSVYGAGFAGETVQSASVPLPVSLGGVEVEFNGVKAPLFAVVRGADFGLGFDQVNAQLPWEVDASSGTAQVVISRDGVRSDELTAQVAAVSPGIFTFQAGPGAAIVQNFSLGNDDVIPNSIAQPEGSIPGVVTQPAAVGGAIVIFANGLGPVSPAGETGQIGGTDPLRVTTRNVRVLIDDVEAPIIGTPVLHGSLVALNQINAFVPAVDPGDAVPIQLEVDGVLSRDDVTIAVRPAP